MFGLVDRNPFYKLFHFLFGWDYILFHYGFGEHIKRVRVAPNGLEYVQIGMDMHYLSRYRNQLCQVSQTRETAIPFIALT